MYSFEKLKKNFLWENQASFYHLHQLLQSLKKEQLALKEGHSEKDREAALLNMSSVKSQNIPEQQQ